MLKRPPAIEAVSAEIHARPHPEFSSPYRISHLAMQHGSETTSISSADQERAHIGSLCERYNAAKPVDELHWTVDLGVYRLIWERHTEFSTYSFMAPAQDNASAVAKPVIDLVPSDWITGLTGDVLVACHFTFVTSLDGIDRERLFNGHRQIASKVGDGGTAIVWTALRTLHDGFGHYLVEDQNVSAGRTGRLAQRLMEIETYRTVALLGLNVARRISPEIAAMDRRLSEITNALREDHDNRKRLDELFELASDTERMQAQTAFRFGATRAYGELVSTRLERLREQRLPDHQRLSEFLARRFEPALRTCSSMAERLDGLSQRIARTADLVRTRVDIELQEQNRSLLKSMEKRAGLQLRLQQTVEGLSVVAISYYAVSLLAYVIKGIEGALPVAPEVALAVAAPVILLAAWLGLRLVKRRMLARHEQE